MPILWQQRGPDAAWFLIALGLARVPLLLSDVVGVNLHRHARYASLAVISLLARSIPQFVALAWVWRGGGAWGLIVRDVLLAVLSFLTVYYWSGQRFRGQLSRDSFFKIMRFSGPMFVSMTLDTLALRFDRLVVGSWFGNVGIGLYHQARFVADSGMVATMPVNQVTLNLYARLQDQRARLARSFSVVNYYLARFFVGVSALLIVYPAELLLLVLGEEWVEVAPILRILGLYAGLLPVLHNMQIMLWARGQVMLNVRIRILQLAFFVPVVLAAAWLGTVPGIAASLLLSHVIALGLAWYFTRDLSRGEFRHVFGNPTLALAATVGLLLSPPVAAAVEGLAFWIRPALPPLVVWILVGALDRGRLLEELRYLRSQILGSHPPNTEEATP